MSLKHPDQKASTSPKTHHCFKCLIMKRLWMVMVNMYDFMGLIEMCPCNSLHAIKPYITSKQ